MLLGLRKVLQAQSTSDRDSLRSLGKTGNFRDAARWGVLQDYAPASGPQPNKTRRRKDPTCFCSCPIRRCFQKSLWQDPYISFFGLSALCTETRDWMVVYYQPGPLPTFLKPWIFQQASERNRLLQAPPDAEADLLHFLRNPLGKSSPARRLAAHYKKWQIRPTSHHVPARLAGSGTFKAVLNLEAPGLL